MNHKNIHRFQLKAKIADDSHFIQQRETQEKYLIEEMRDKGYVPVLDLGPDWSTALDDKEHYDSLLTMYGIYVGRKKSWDFMGVSATGTFFPAATPKSKLSKSSTDAL